jgi:DNA adenine methylase
MSIKIQKPFIKWVGGKTQIMDDIIKKIPNEMNNYHEIFLGGGSVLLAVLSLKKAGKITINNSIYAYDLNNNLINLYKNIQSHKDELYDKLKYYYEEYDSLTGSTINRKPQTEEEGKTSKESYYYWVRNKFNTMDKNSIEYSAIFIFLNKTCFRGVYREGPKGFNVPYGHYKITPQIISKEEVDNISELIKDVEFIQSDFTNSIPRVKKGDFVYLDPPYVPENATSFVGYTSDGFPLESHKKLFEMIKSFNRKKIKFMMSNSNVKLVTDTFKPTKTNHYKIEEIDARRAINSKKPDSITKEVIITN